MRGFSIIGLVRPKTGENVGGVLRAAGCYGVTQINLEGVKPYVLRHGTNTQKYERHSPVFCVDHVLDYVPVGCEVVCVDLVSGAKPLPSFHHPERAVYVFGPENGTLGEKHLSRADRKVYIPTRHCMNLAAAVNVVLYDRLAKGQASFMEYAGENAA